MRATKSGIECKKEELKALLAFTGDDLRFSVVHFRITSSGKVVASATDGRRAVEVTSQNDGADPGEWAFDREYLDSVFRVLDAGETCAVLEVSHKGASKAVIRAIDGGSKRTEIKCPVGSVSTQISMDAIRDVLGEAHESGSWFALNALYLSDVQSVAKAADKCPLSIFPPKDPTGPVRFEARSEEGAWRGVIMPMRVVGPGDEADKEAEELPPPEPDPGEPLELTPSPKGKGRRAAKALIDTLDRHGASFTVVSGDESVTVGSPKQKGKGRKSKATAESAQP